ncbi:acid phosphatase/Vanadium-dependent haloperoxidase [Sistotremastrum niveocremeum HHB9708]|uniref:Acid phosphatase/Vanadium-dependent haloperoxidase n=1 Tax=Sistotremastrum niveocremeum HHB9708 TaxID=1314777 RepID=A0A164YSI8_9AGAM|nr:acid phosphatase/Vanadium-dependent haloperoxidase [Sistotremastrum niveocremeum HHB9708]
MSVTIQSRTLPDSVYESTLGPWRAALRRRVIMNLERESQYIASMQSWLRSPLLDRFFVYTSSLGTHTFFMIALPFFFFFGFHDIGRDLISVLAMGVYTSSLLKDLVCAPRPHVPPVTRLSFGSHHREYGFPSTHSTNSVSVALYILLLLLSNPTLSTTAFTLSCILLSIYTLSIVFGRIYCGMHSFTDCMGGTLLGALVTVFWWVLGDPVVLWLKDAAWTVPLTLVPLALFMINRHPQPVDDCPCFEDAIAFVSVLLGIFLSEWHMSLAGLNIESGFYTSRTPGSSGTDLNSWLLWTLFAALKMVTGVLTIFVWRLVAKATLHAVLPPTFRFFAQMIELPHRRFYTPATEYGDFPKENGLHPIPSVIDLPSMNEVKKSHGAYRIAVEGGLKKRHVRNEKNVNVETESSSGSEGENNENNEMGNVKHYDATVLTKTIVYAGIGFLAAEGIPACFEVMGWGVERS